MAIDRTQLPWHEGRNGATNYTRNVIQQRARQILEGDDYQASLNLRIKTGTLPAQVETMLWWYAYGKPVEHVNIAVSQTEDLSQLSVADLLERAKALSDQIADVVELEQAIPAQYKVA